MIENQLKLNFNNNNKMIKCIICNKKISKPNENYIIEKILEIGKPINIKYSCKKCYKEFYQIGYEYEKNEIGGEND